MSNVTNYNFIASDIPGAQYHRASTVRLINPRGVQKSVVYEIEEITNTLDGRYVSTPGGSVYVQLPLGDDEMRHDVINLYSLEGEPRGTITGGEMIDTIMLYLNSHMIHDTTKTKNAILEAEAREIALEEERLAQEALDDEAQRLQELANAQESMTAHQAEIDRLQVLLDTALQEIDDDAEDPEVDPEPAEDPEVDPEP